MALIRVNSLEKTFRLKTKRFKALNGMSFEIEQGEILGFLGPNGAGKSTTIKIMMDLIRADSGSVEIAGVDSRNPEAKKNIGFMPENPQYFDTLTGFDLLIFTASVFGIDKKQASKKAWQLLEEFGLKEAAKRPIRKYSKGMIQRVGFAAALIHEPQILILDEPMSGLDPIGRILFKNKMKELNEKGVTIFFSSHIIPDIEDICSRVLIVNKGKAIKSLTREEIKFMTTTGFNVIIDRCIDELNCAKISGNLYSIESKKDELIAVLKRIESYNVKIVDIEPVKKDLEEVFVELIK
ncbi:ABC transporter ATP-binding protein [Hippea maritima]|uniref:Sulfate-transporting ATPase n=1 Tax=Hippea maritima (strain ATCC 700847 / DSM 10411 / MH2) TaxID=760142 RepID=F2LVB8_HIPMA|nr:ABC transporter ATP-binding protein [Hippea maritima]AEA33702.1 Sulfate-transporting ATPase [Hippea maritima DSM 10411]